VISLAQRSKKDKNMPGPQLGVFHLIPLLLDLSVIVHHLLLLALLSLTLKDHFV
jgi:hypothetical protein